MENQYVWKVTLDDGTEINQFTNIGETLYREVENAMDKVKLFRLSETAGDYFEVNLIKGSMDFNGKFSESIRLSSEKKANLIYKRRNKVILTDSGGICEKTMAYLIGICHGDDIIRLEIMPHHNKWLLYKKNIDGEFNIWI